MRTNQDAASNTNDTAPSTRPPIIWWAGAGIVFFALQTYVLLSWLWSPDFGPIGTGIDPVPAQIRASAWISQCNAVILFLACAVYCLRKSRREGRLTWDALLMIGGLSVFWLDTAINYFRPIVLYNATMLNWGSWSPYIPGWVSAARTPEPLIFVIGLYGWWFLLFSASFCWIARSLQRYWPRIPVFFLILVGIAALSILDAILELIFVFSGLYVYVAVIPGWTLWLGSMQQFPLYGPLILGVLCTAVAMLRYDARERHYSFVERGFDKLPLSPWMQTMVRMLAIIGYLNTVFLFAVFFHWLLGLYAVQLASPLPSYFF